MKAKKTTNLNIRNIDPEVMRKFQEIKRNASVTLSTDLTNEDTFAYVVAKAHKVVIK